MFCQKKLILKKYEHEFIFTFHPFHIHNFTLNRRVGFEIIIFYESMQFLYTNIKQKKQKPKNGSISTASAICILCGTT